MPILKRFIQIGIKICSSIERGDRVDLINELLDKNRELSTFITLLRKYGQELAEAERNYKVKLSETALKLKADKMPITLIDKVVYGQKEVAELRFKRDSAEVMYQVALEKINVTKLQIKILQNQVDKEWGQAK